MHNEVETDDSAENPSHPFPIFAISTISKYPFASAQREGHTFITCADVDRQRGANIIMDNESGENRKRERERQRKREKERVRERHGRDETMIKIKKRKKKTIHLYRMGKKGKRKLAPFGNETRGDQCRRLWCRTSGFDH